MVVLNRIYTRAGDSGDTALSDGARAKKNAPRVSAYGAVDETNATVGLARLHADGEADAALARIQNDLFDLGADLSTPDPAGDGAKKHPPLRMVPAQTERLEAEIDAMNAALAPLRSFVLPGGSALAAHLHLCRTVARRAERETVALMEAEPGGVSPAALTYLNRLSDWFFVAARRANENGARDVLWIPGANR